MRFGCLAYFGFLILLLPGLVNSPVLNRIPPAINLGIILLVPIILSILPQTRRFGLGMLLSMLISVVLVLLLFFAICGSAFPGRIGP